MPINQNQALFSLLGTTYGGDGMRTFALPDLRGRVPAGASQNSPLGQFGGQEAYTLQVPQMPAHAHALMADATSRDVGNEPSPFYGPRAWGSVEYLLWFVTPMNTPPLIQTVPASVASVGSVLPPGAAGKYFPFDRQLEFGAFSGVRGTAGYMFDRFGLEVSGFYLPKVTRSAALDSDDLKKQYDTFNATPAPSTPAQFADFVRAEQAKWGPVVRKTGIKLD